MLIAAAIFAARALSDWDGKRSPRGVAAVANGIEKAQFLVSILEAKRSCKWADKSETLCTNPACLAKAKENES